MSKIVKGQTQSPLYGPYTYGDYHGIQSPNWVIALSNIFNKGPVCTFPLNVEIFFDNLSNYVLLIWDVFSIFTE